MRALLNEHWHPLNGIAGAGTTTTTTPSPPGTTSTFPTDALSAIYDADLGVTDVSRPSSAADAYQWLQPDAAYNAVGAIADQSGHGHTLFPTLAHGPMHRLNIVNGHATILGPGGGDGWPMQSTSTGGFAIKGLTFFAVARPAWAGATYINEFGIALGPGISLLEFGTLNGRIGGEAVSLAAVTQLDFGGSWTGSTTSNTPFDILVWRWDGVTIDAFRNGFALGSSAAFSGPTTTSFLFAENGQIEWTAWGFWGRALTNDEIAGVFSTQSTKYAITVAGIGAVGGGGAGGGSSSDVAGGGTGVVTQIIGQLNDAIVARNDGNVMTDRTTGTILFRR